MTSSDHKHVRISMSRKSYIFLVTSANSSFPNAGYVVSVTVYTCIATKVTPLISPSAAFLQSSPHETDLETPIEPPGVGMGQDSQPVVF